MKQALIVGVQGQDGQLLSKFLSAKGYSVTGLSRQAACLPDERLAPPVDVTDACAVAELIRKLCPGEIYYLAAFHHSSQQAMVLDTQGIWAASLAINATGPVNFLEAVCRHSPSTRFFYAGSCLAYGRPDRTPQTEDTCFSPSCVYGITKVAGAHAVRLYRETHGVFAVAGILYNHESHLRPEHFLSRKVVRAAVRIKRGLERDLVLADLSAQADWGYAPDFVEAFWKTLQVETPQDCVIATGTLHSVRDWVKKSFALAGLNWQEHVSEVVSLAIRKRPLLVGDISRIREGCGWTPTTGFDRMIELMFEQEEQHT